MKTCLICHREKPYRAFPKDSPICNKCVERLNHDYDVQYSPPEKLSRKTAYLSLVKAIRDQAEVDGELEDWEEYWLRSPEWRLVWSLFSQSFSGFSTYFSSPIPNIPVKGDGK